MKRLKGLGQNSVKGPDLVVIDTQVLVDEVHRVRVCDLNMAFIEAVANIVTFCQRTVALKPFQSGYQAPVAQHESVDVLKRSIFGA